LSREELSVIWSLSDNDRDNKLSMIEFAVATHLIICKTRKNLRIPATLPSELHPSALRLESWEVVMATKEADEKAKRREEAKARMKAEVKARMKAEAGASKGV
jgi:hypothetical protein